MEYVVHSIGHKQNERNYKKIGFPFTYHFCALRDALLFAARDSRCGWTVKVYQNKKLIRIFNKQIKKF